MSVKEGRGNRARCQQGERQFKRFDKFVEYFLVFFGLFLILFIVYLIFSLSIYDETGFPDNSISTHRASLLTEDFVDMSAWLNYTITILPTVNKIRSKNLVFERNGLIPENEQLKYCSEVNNIQICTHSNFPVVHKINGVIEVQEPEFPDDYIGHRLYRRVRIE